MYMLKSVVSVAIFAAAAIAQSTNLAFTSFPPTTAAAGSPITLTWIGGDESAPVTITLKKGLSTDLKDVGVLTSSATGGSFTWTPDTTISNGADYALAISQGSLINYTGQFSVTGGSTAAATTASTSASASASASASSSAASSVSSAAASSTGSITSAAAALSTTASSSNGTVTSATLSSTDSSASTTGSSTLRTSSTTRTATSSGASASSSTVPATGGASGLQSPIALFFGVVAAMLYLQ